MNPAAAPAPSEWEETDVCPCEGVDEGAEQARGGLNGHELVEVEGAQN